MEELGLRRMGMERCACQFLNAHVACFHTVREHSLRWPARTPVVVARLCWSPRSVTVVFCDCILSVWLYFVSVTIYVCAGIWRMRSL
jgi:hypothetical protein